MRILICLIVAAVLAVPSHSVDAARKKRVPAATASKSKAGTGTIAGQVVGPKGGLVARARVRVHRARHPGLHPRVRGGRFATRAIVAGTYIVNAHSRGVGSGRAIAVVTPGNATAVIVRLHSLHKHAHQLHSLGVAHHKATNPSSNSTKNPAPAPNPAARVGGIAPKSAK